MPFKDPEVRRAYDREHYWRHRKEAKRKKKQTWVEKLGGKCSKCGYNKCLEALHFHHQDPSEKEFAIFDTWRSEEAIKGELEKCILVCANCHAEIHSSWPISTNG